MTAQIPETLKYDGQQLALLINPLQLFFEFGGANSAIQSTSTALWRGYVGICEIVNDPLYMVEHNCVLNSGEKTILESIFPSKTTSNTCRSGERAVQWQ